jgi:hypothetical protein
LLSVNSWSGINKLAEVLLMWLCTRAQSESATRASSLTIPWSPFRNQHPTAACLSGVTDCAAQTSGDNTFLDEIRNTEEFQ